MNLDIKKLTIKSIKEIKDGKVYNFYESEEVLITRSYSLISNFLSNVIGANDELKIGKTLYLVSDFNRLLVISDGFNFLFINDLIDKDTLDIKYEVNKDYINKEYNLNKEEFIDYVKGEMKSKKLVKKLN